MCLHPKWTLSTSLGRCFHDAMWLTDRHRHHHNLGGLSIACVWISNFHQSACCLRVTDNVPGLKQALQSRKNQKAALMKLGARIWNETLGSSSSRASRSKAWRRWCLAKASCSKILTSAMHINSSLKAIKIVLGRRREHSANSHQGLRQALV